LFEPDRDRAGLVHVLTDLVPDLSPEQIAFRIVEDQDWTRAWMDQFQPMRFGRRLWIYPWNIEPPADDPDAIVVRLDPGLAFGTGTHSSTRLVLSYLERTIHGGERVLDYGCGSGILAIAAAKLGAAQVDGVDVDPQAVETSLANARANRVALQATLPDALGAGHYDVVVSNILAQPLILLAPLLAARGPRIALSGILDDQAEEVARAYERWFEVRTTEREERWVLLEGERR